MNLIQMLVAALMAFALSGGAVHAQTELDFSIDITAVVDPVFPGEGQGYAGVAFDGTHFWVAKWASDRITRIAPDGSYFDSFTVPGLSGTRSLTWDGSEFWAANNSSTLSEIDPATLTVVSTITVAVAEVPRFASFDASADGGNGGFWIGNFNTDIVLVDMGGNELSRISAVNLEAISGRYGAAFDSVSFGQPLLWVFSQSGTSTTELTAVDLSTGQPIPYPQNLLEFAPALTSGLAGGLYFANGTQPGMPNLLALIQGTPNNTLLALNFLEFSIFKDSFDIVAAP